MSIFKSGMSKVGTLRVQGGPGKDHISRAQIGSTLGNSVSLLLEHANALCRADHRLSARWVGCTRCPAFAS